MYNAGPLILGEHEDHPRLFLMATLPAIMLFFTSSRHRGGSHLAQATRNQEFQQEQASKRGKSNKAV